MRFINLRFLILTLVVIAAVAGGVYGWHWWRNKPENLYASAKEYFTQAEEARRANDLKTAQALYQSSSERLVALLDKSKAPNHVPGMVLLSRVLVPLGQIVGKEDPEKGRKLEEEGMTYALRAAVADPANLEAQTIMLRHFFLIDQAEGATQFAQNLISHLPPPGQPPPVEDLDNFIAGAYFVLAHDALRNRRADDALKLLEDCAGPEQRSVKDGRVPKWRTIDLTVRATRLKAEQTSRSRGPQPKPGDDPLASLQERVAKWIDRARAERAELVPAAEGKPALPVIANLSPTDLRGLLNFLLTSIQIAPDKDIVQERITFLLDVCQVLIEAENTKPHVAREATACLNQLPEVLPRLSARQLPPQEAVNAAYDQVVKINETALKKGVPIKPRTYLDMAQAVRSRSARDITEWQKNMAQAYDLVRKGLMVADEQKLPATDPTRLDLHTEAAAILLLQKKTAQAEKEHLAELRKFPQLTPNVNYLQGLAAVLDGRLEEGVSKLEAARTHARLAESFPLLLALSHAYMGQGKYSRAVPVLVKIDDIYKKKQLKGEDDYFRQIFMPDPSAVWFDLYRCYLALAAQTTLPLPQRESYRDAAARLRSQLKETPARAASDALLINAYVAEARRLRQDDPLQADHALATARQILEASPQVLRNDPRLVWAEVNLVLNEPVSEPAVMASAVALPLTAGTDLGLRLAQNNRVQAGLAWHWIKAEELVARLATQKDNLSARLGWVHWLRMNGRWEEALAYLEDLQRSATSPDMKRRLETFEVYLRLTRGQTEEADKQLKELQQSNPDYATDILSLIALLQSGGGSDVEARIKESLQKYQQSGLLYYWQGQLNQANGNLTEAIRSYERSLQFTQFKAASQVGLMNSVLSLVSSPKGGADVAHKEATRLAAAYPNDPVILLTYAQTSRLMDNVYAKDGMQGALERMQEVLAAENLPAASGAYVAAVQWNLAGRPDLARKELEEKALRPTADQKPHLPSLILAGQLANADEDWPAVERYLAALEKAAPDAIEVPLWRAAHHLSQGETEKAKKIYEEFVKKYPQMNSGYLALAQIQEKAKDYPAALAWIKKWRDKQPDDLTGLRAELRIRARSGQGKEADKLGAEFLDKQLKDFQVNWDANVAKLPAPKDDKEKERRANAREEARNAAALVVVLTVAGGLQDGEAYDLAEDWIRRHGLPLVDKLPEQTRKPNRISLQLLLGTLYLEQGRKEKDKAKRDALMAKAINAYEEVWKLSPGHLIAGNNLAWLLTKEKNDAARAVNIVEDVRKGRYSQQPISGERLPLELLDTLGEVYRAAGKKDEALKLFQQAVQRYGNEPRILYHLGRAYGAAGNTEEAYRQLSRAIDLAEVKSRTTPDPDRKAKLQEVAVEARKEQLQFRPGRS